MATWRCMKQCGACCHLDPEERPGLEQYLSPSELALYISLVGPDGWCINFDRATKECTIYADRPQFCRVEEQTYQRMFGIKPEELNDFAIECCEQQIEAIYGDRSLELLRFQREVGLSD